MKHFNSSSARLAAAPVLFSTLLAATSVAQPSDTDTPPPAVTARAQADALAVQTGQDATVLYDQPGDGRLWARGRSWKASFGTDGATYFPRVGADQKSFAHTLSPESVTVGGQPLAFEPSVSAARDGDRVSLDRGSFVETYDLAASSVEQSFVFSALPRAGDLVLKIQGSSDIQPVDTDDGVDFRSIAGNVKYTRAVAIDGRGRHAQAVTHVEDGSVVIRVGADFLATATMPLVVDPFVLNPIFPDNTQSDTFSMDTAYDTFNGVWLVIWEQVYSSTDHDVYAKMYTNSGTEVASATVDFTSDLWTAPRCAYLLGAHQFLVVAGATAATGGAKTVRGRTVQANGTIISQGSQFDISGSAAGDKVRPDVGGDPYPAANASYYCVAFEHDINNAIPVPDHRVAFQMVDANSNLLLAAPTYFSATSVEEGYPSVSKSNDTTNWLIAWQRQDQLTHGDILAAHVHWNGAVVDGPFGVSGGPSFDAPPSASSPLYGTQRFAVTFHRGISPSRDIMVAALDGTTVLQTVDLTTLEASGVGATDQIEPSVDSDGEHFLVSYSEFLTAFGYYEIFGSELGLAGNSLVLLQSHQQPQVGLGLSQRNSQVAAARGTGTLAHRYLVVYDFRQNDTDHDLGGRFFDGIAGGSFGTFCAGDGTGTACPCGNNGASGHGCGNSVAPGGALLQVSSGVASTLSDTLHLQATSLPGNSSCLVFQGATLGTGATFGDGLRCATGTTIRLANKTASPTGVVTYPSGSDAPISVQGAIPVEGATRAYQVWYRNAGAFCTSSTFNLSNGLFVSWTR